MKKIIAVVAVVLLVASMLFVFTGCGENDNKTTTTTTLPTTSEVTLTENPGIVTDESNKGENGVLGDIVTDVSEDVSDMVTDMSEDVSRMIRSCPPKPLRSRTRRWNPPAPGRGWRRRPRGRRCAAS